MQPTRQPTSQPTKRATDSEGGIRKTHGRVHVAHALCNGVSHDHFHPAVLPTSRAADVEVIPGQVHGASHPDVQLPGLRHQAAVRRAQDGQEQQPAVPPGRPVPARRRSWRARHGDGAWPRKAPHVLGWAVNDVSLSWGLVGCVVMDGWLYSHGGLTLSVLLRTWCADGESHQVTWR